MNNHFPNTLSKTSPVTWLVLAAIAVIAGCAMLSEDNALGGAPGSIMYDYDQGTLFNTEEYASVDENPFLPVSSSPLSTFSIDVDAASYSNCRRFITTGSLPPAGAVRIEEFVNYFAYEYPEPKDSDPVGAHVEIAECPWNSSHSLAKIGVRARTIAADNLPPAHLTFLIDVSGSMGSDNKLPLLKQAFGHLLEKLREEDMVAIIVYSGAAGVRLQPTSGGDKSTINAALARLTAGGSTAGGAGIVTAYDVAEKMYSGNATNRVILATDGDFNVGESSEAGLVELIKKKRDKGIYLTVLGFGMGNLKDSKMEALADNGNGNYAYVDGVNEAKRVFLNEFGGTIFTVAKDVKIQVEFNPSMVKAYRLIGYENRVLHNEDFNNDTVDAGEVGSGQTVTALYELIPSSSEEEVPGVDSLRYQAQQAVADTAQSGEFFYVKIRYKDPDGTTGRLIEEPAGLECFTEFPSSDFSFAAAVAEFGLLLRPSKYRGDASFSHAASAGEEHVGTDLDGFRKEFVELVRRAQELSDTLAEEGMPD